MRMWIPRRRSGDVAPGTDGSAKGHRRQESTGCARFLAYIRVKQRPVMKVRSAFAVLAAVACAIALPHAQQAVQVLDVPGVKIRVVTVATGLFHPWSLA